ncbi:hypothetical protein [Microbacterium sp. 69-10]|uniref:hypothetical protein n=1 Tax=Microbacterium sp. 69-10 TaxID=1895783 RepID=UPI0025FAF9AD|nr:hypothetical protein [Microbacterium sp. 69-10]
MPTTERTAAQQLATARLLLGQFEAQLREWKHMGAKKRLRSARGKDLARRMPGLKAGHAKWTARVEDLEARAAAEQEAGT